MKLLEYQGHCICLLSLLSQGATDVGGDTTEMYLWHFWGLEARGQAGRMDFFCGLSPWWSSRCTLACSLLRACVHECLFLLIKDARPIASGPQHYDFM